MKSKKKDKPAVSVLPHMGEVWWVERVATEPEECNELRKELAVNALQLQLVFKNLDELTGALNGPGAAKLKARWQKKPPTLVLLDWEEGASVGVYEALRDWKIDTLKVLMSATPRAYIEEDPVNGLARYPGIEPGHVLSRPVGVSAVLAKLYMHAAVFRAAPQERSTSPTAAKPGGTLSSRLKGFGAQFKDSLPSLAGKAKGKAKGGETESLTAETPPPALYGAWRWLDAKRRPLYINRGWQLNIDRPPVSFRDDELKQLEDSGELTQTTWSLLPQNKDAFGRVLLHTVKLRAADTEAPHGACYVQHSESAPDIADPVSERGVVRSIIHMMELAGFPRGRFYRLTRVPGVAKPVLELTVVEPQTSGAKPPPVAVPMDKSEERQFKRYQQWLTHSSRYPRSGTELLHELTTKALAKGQTDPEAVNDRQTWDHYVSLKEVDESLVVPVYFSNSEVKERHGNGFVPPDDPAPSVRGAFVFDLGKRGLIEQRPIEVVKPALLAALRNFGALRHEAQRRYEQELQGHLYRLHDQLGACENLEQTAQALCAAVVEVLTITERNHEQGLVSLSADRRTATFVRHDALHESLVFVAQSRPAHPAHLQPLQPGDHYRLNRPRFFVVRAALNALKAIEEGKPVSDADPVFVPSVRQLPQEDQLTDDDWRSVFGNDEQRMAAVKHWLEHELHSAIAIPVGRGMQLIGALVVRSANEFEFTSRRVRAVQGLAQAASAHIHRVMQRTRHDVWHGLIAHEMRTGLGRVAAALREQPPALERARLFLKLATTVSITSTLLSPTDGRDGWASELATTNAWADIRSFADLMCEQASNAGTTVSWIAAELPALADGSGPRLQNEDAFLRVMLVLLDNAFRHGGAADGTSHELALAVRVPAPRGPGFQHVTIELVNEGRLDDAVLQHLSDPCAVNAWLDDSPATAKRYMGLSLASLLCQQSAASLKYVTSQERVHTALMWPVQPATNEQPSSR